MFELGLDFFGVLGIDDADGAGEVTEGGRIAQIQRGRLVVGQNPREDGILRQIVVRPAGDGVQLQSDDSAAKLINSNAYTISHQVVEHYSYYC